MSFKVDFSKFKKLSSDKDHTVMVHEDGHQLRIAHGPLSPQAKKQLKGLPMADGGETKKVPPGGSGSPYIDKEKAKEIEKGATKSGWQPDEWVKNIKDSMKADGGDIEAPSDASPAPQSDAIESPQPDTSPIQLPVSEVPAAEAPPVAASPTQMESPSLPIASTPEQLQGQLAIPAEQTQPQLQPSNPEPVKSMNPDMMEGYKKEQAGIALEQQGQQQQVQQQAQDLKAHVAAVQDLVADYKTHYDDLDKERKAYIADIDNGHIDPNRYMGSMDTNQRTLTTIGLFLGGFGSQGGSNQALDFLNKQIDRDIDAQKTQLGTKETLLSANLKQFGNLNTATEMTKVMMGDQIQNQLKLAEAKAGTPLARARALQLSGQLEQKFAPTMQSVALKQMLSSGDVSNVDPAQVVAMVVPKEHQKTVFGEIEAAQNTKRMGGTINKAFEEAVKENTVAKTGAGLLRTPASVYALHQAMQPTFKDLEGTVRQAAMDNTFKNITPAPGDSNHTIEQKREALRGYLQSKASAPTAKGFGIDLDRFNSTKPNTETKVHNGATYEKVQGGWKLVRGK